MESSFHSAFVRVEVSALRVIAGKNAAAQHLPPSISLVLAVLAAAAALAVAAATAAAAVPAAGRLPRRCHLAGSIREGLVVVFGHRGDNPAALLRFGHGHDDDGEKDTDAHHHHAHHAAAGGLLLPTEVPVVVMQRLRRVADRGRVRTS